MMASNKKRKLNGLAEPKIISAIAARKQLQAVGVNSKSLPQREAQTSFGGYSIPDLGPSVHAPSKWHDSPDCAEDVINDGNVSDTSSYSKGESVVSASRAEEPVDISKIEVHLTTLNPCRDNIEELEGGSILIKLAPGERIVVHGEYGVSVAKGQITILGAVLSASDAVYPVFALSSHSLPVIRFLSSENNRAEIRLYESLGNLRSLQKLSPLFARLWPGGRETRESQQKLSGCNSQWWKSRTKSFEIIFSNDDVSRKTLLRSIVCPPEWSKALATTWSGSCNQSSPTVTMICGPKSSGKSTFAKLLINRLVTCGMSISEQTTTVSVKPQTSNVAFLDIDPGQPEYSPPGQLSLVYITEPNFGLPYSHPDASDTRRECIRAHSIASNSPVADTTLYMACVIDLLCRYRSLSLEKKCPLVINTPGWVLGTGLELLVELIREARPTDIIYMSQEGPSDVVQSLKDAAGPIPFVMLPSQPTELTTRTAAHLRSMQAMSYLHLSRERQGRKAWDPRPLVSIPPLVVKYAGNDAGIFGVMCLGEQPPAEMILDTINGTLVAVVIMDGIVAIPGLRNTIGVPDSDGHSDRVRFGDWKIDHAETTESEHPIFDNQGEQVITQTPELIPYFNPKITMSLDPRYTRTIGLALIRGVDTERRRFHLLSPISSTVVEDIRLSGKLIVLVSGKLDTPGWAYTEHFYRRDMVEKVGKTQTTKLLNNDAEDSRDARDDSDLDNQSDLGADFECAPWTERMQGDQGRGAGARVWRVRRNLSKSAID